MMCFVRAVEIVNLGRLNPTVITKVAQMGTGHSICNKEKNTKCVKSERKCMKVSSKKRSEQDCTGNAEEVCADCTEKAIYKEGILVGKEFAEKQKDKEVAVAKRHDNEVRREFAEEAETQYCQYEEICPTMFCEDIDDLLKQYEVKE